MKLNDFYNEVSRIADNDTQKITVAETKRVLACAFDILAGMDALELADTLKNGLSTAKKRIDKKK